MKGDFLEVVEWRIEGFCNWNSEAHHCKLQSAGPLQNRTTRFELYPEGRKSYNLVGDGHLTVRIVNKECADLSGDLSIIASDGYLLSFHIVNTRSNEEFYQGPKFDDVVAHIRNRESIHKDSITIQFRFKSAYPSKHFMSDSINASDMSFKFDTKFIENLISERSKHIAHIKCLSNAVDMLLIAGYEGESIFFSLEQEGNIDAFWLESCMNLVSSEGNIVSHEKFGQLFYEGGPWRYLGKLNKENIIGTDNTIHLHLKFLDVNLTKGFHDELSHLAKDVSELPKNNLCCCKKESSDSLATSNQADKSVTILSNDLLCLFQDKEFSDLELKCGDVSFPVHRNILSARSPVFKRLLSSNMIEATSGTVDIKDLDASTLSLFLTHLYAGTIEDMQLESCLKLYYAADKYDVPTLKRECSDFFRANISVSNVCDILSLADQHNDDLLTLSAYSFTLKNFQEVTGSEEWKSFVKSKPLMVAELLTHFAQKKYITSGNAKLCKK